MASAAARMRPWIGLITMFVLACRDDGGVVIDSASGTGPGRACGDGTVDPGEACDDGNDDDRDACTNACQLPVCGDGITGADETCDDGNDVDDDACTATCELGPASIVDVAAGGSHTCALSQLGLVRCWGDGDYGKLAQPGYTDDIGDDEPPSDWAPIEVGDGVVELVAGAFHTCARMDGGTLRCWGLGSSGALGYGDDETVGDDETPAQAGDIALPRPVISVAAGSHHGCAALDDGAVYCWGSASDGQLGIGDGDTTPLGDDEAITARGPVDVGGAAVAVVAGDAHSCALVEGGRIACWGNGDYGQPGYGIPQSVGDDETPGSLGFVDVGGTAQAIAAGWDHTCALLDDGAVRCWGLGGRGQLGNGDTMDVGDRKLPAELPPVDLGGLTAIQIDASADASCALREDGRVQCWGDCDIAATCIGSELLPVDPVPMGGLATAITLGDSHACARMDTGTMRCWGANGSGALGYELSPNTTVHDPSEHGDVDVF